MGSSVADKTFLLFLLIGTNIGALFSALFIEILLVMITGIGWAAKSQDNSKSLTEIFPSYCGIFGSLFSVHFGVGGGK